MTSTKGSFAGTERQVIGYVRVSTDEQADSGAGLVAQREAIAREVERRGWRLLAVYEDAGASGKSVAGRPGLAQALTVLESGKAGALLVAKLDRLSRSLMDFASLMERSRRRGWALVALDLGVDTTSPAGEMMASVVATFAQYERRLIGQRTRDALAVKRAQGIVLGRRRVVTDSTVRLASRLRSKGLTLHAVANELTARGVPTGQGAGRWYPSTVQMLLRRS